MIPSSGRAPLAPSDASLAEAVVRASVDGVAVIDRDARYTLWNPAMERFTGKAAAEVLGRRAPEVFTTPSDRELEGAYERVLAGEAVAAECIFHVEPDGAKKVYDRLYSPLRDTRGEIAGVMIIVRDASERSAAREALRASETKLLMAAEATGIGLWSWDPTADVITWEDTMCGLYGLPPGGAPTSREQYLSLIHPDDRERSRQRIVRGTTEGHWDHEYRIIRPDGALRWLASRTRQLHTDRGDLVVGAVFDVTERREIEERQRATQRLEVVGQLTAGIAHNFNNLLMGIVPTLELVSRRAPPDLLPLLGVAEQSALRAAAVVRQLMTYANRDQGASRRVESIAPLVERTVSFCRTTFERRIRIDLRCRGLDAAEIDSSQIEQAVLNLLINARDALDDTPDPEIDVLVEPLSSAAAELEGYAGEWIAIRVADNGIGMDEGTVQRVYEPFFTTKPVGKGTGLGLATTQAILRNHGGFITCHSAPGRGTTFTLYLPSSAGSTAPIEASEDVSPAAQMAWAESTTILVVDDDDQVRAVTTRILEDSGFDVASVASGGEALAWMADPSRAARVELVLLDVSMPGMSGPQTRMRLGEMAPRLPVVFLTGYAFEPQAGDTVLQKPITKVELVSAIRSVLGKRALG